MRNSYLAVGVILCSLLFGCNKSQHVGTATSGTTQYDLICIDHVKYIKDIDTLNQTEGLAVKFNKNGNIEVCD